MGVLEKVAPLTTRTDPYGARARRLAAAARLLEGRPELALPLVERETSGLGTVLRARALEALGTPEPAAELYGAAAADPDLAPLAPDLLWARALLTGAFEEGLRALEEGLPSPRREELVRSLAVQALAAGRVADLLPRVEGWIPEEDPELLLSLGELYRAAGRPERARLLWQTLLEEHPASPWAPVALEGLRDLGDPPSPYWRARLLYNQGEVLKAWQVLSDTVETADPQLEEGARTLYLGGLLLWAQGDLEGARGLLERIAPTGGAALPDELYDRFWWDLARLRDLTGEPPTAAEAALQALARARPEHPTAPAALARVVERRWERGDREGMAAAREELVRRFPDDPRSARWTFLEGWQAYRSGDLEAAADLWAPWVERLRGWPRARIAFWLGKARAALGDREGAEAAWATALAAAPRTYEGVRAAELLEQPLPLPLSAAPPVTATRTLAADPVLTRTWLLQEVGWVEEARQVWRAWWEAHAEEGPRRAALAALVDQGDLALAARLLQEWEEAPEDLLPYRFPRPFAEAVAAAAAEFDLDPDLLYGLIRQESFYEPRARSHADAYGLTQVIPSTGETIARQLGVEPFRPEDLYDPRLALRFGAFYLRAQLDRFGVPQVALAAYNGGPGNAARWWAQAGGDPDRFVEAIDFPETYGYVRAVYTFWKVYDVLPAGP